jgi:type IV pilus assembly protein PilE
MKPTRLPSGFTLLELVTTLAIVSILIIVSYPTYTQHIRKTQRAHAHIALLQVASALEHYYVIQNTYAGATLKNLQVNAQLESKSYQLHIEDLTQENYLLKASPEGAQAKDTLCKDLTLDASGRKGVTGTGSIAACW